MTTPDAPDNPHGMDDAHDSPSPSPEQPSAPGRPADPADADSPADAAESAAPADAGGAGDPAAAADPADVAEGDGTDEAVGAGGEELDGTVDEAALRELMREAVRDLRPAPNALDHLRRAVPARRQHRRQALAGTAAAVLLVGAAVPALVHAAAGSGGTTAAPANVASTHAAQPGEDGHVSVWGSTGDSGQPGHGDNRGPSGTQSPTTGGVEGPSSLATTPGKLPPASAPECSGDQLGQGSSKADSPDPDGRIYGWFRVANVSADTCTMPSDPGTVEVITHGPADPSQISVVTHTAGDPATALPATTNDTPLVLAPGEDYEVAFAWVPTDAGPGGCPPPSSPPVSPTPSDTPTDTAVPDPDGSNTADSPVSQAPPPGGPSGPTQPAAISLTHTPAAGAPVIVGPTLQGACAGTVYTTVPIAASATDNSAS